MIHKTVGLFLDGVAEVRIIGMTGKSKWGYARGPIIGFFDDHEKMAAAIAEAEQAGSAKGIYVTINPLTPDLIARANNRLKVGEAGATDNHVTRIRWIPIDIDPVRISGVSSTDAELAGAWTVMLTVADFLESHNIPISVTAHSGNGYHLLIAVEMQPEQAQLSHSFLSVLADMFNTDTVKIDTVNYNPARIWKAYGTTARKGDSTEDRPHRKAEIIEDKGRIIVTPDTIQSFVNSYLRPAPVEEKRNNAPFDLEKFLGDNGVNVVKVKRHGSSTLYCLEHCVFDSSHMNNEAAFGQMDSGKLFYQCFHDSCKDKTWHDAKQVLGYGMSANVSKCQQMSAGVTSSQQMSPVVTSCQYKSVKASTSQADGEQHTVANLVKRYIDQSPGIFTVNDIDNELCLRSREEKNSRASELYRLKKQGFIRQVPGKRGAWKIVDGTLQAMDFTKARPEPLPIILPLGVSELVNIYPRNIIVIAGSSNAGKSAYVSTLIRVNNILTNLGADVSKTHFEQMAPFMCTHPKQTKPNVHFFSSEAGADEMAQRLSDHPGGIEAFAGINFWERERDFAEVIDPNGINVIDYMEVYDNFYEIGAWINDVHRELDKGIAIIVIQKKSGTDIGKGCEVTLEKPRLYLSLENNAPYGGICKIIKAKFPKDPKNDPNGKEIDYRLSHGCNFTELTGWRYVTDKERNAINRGYKIDATNGRYMYQFKLVDGSFGGLNRNDFEKWRDSFPGVDVAGILDRLERDSDRKPWMDKQWYFQVSGMLKKESGKRA